MGQVFDCKMLYLDILVNNNNNNKKKCGATVENKCCHAKFGLLKSDCGAYTSIKRKQ